jgi:hypothetical protein
VEEICVFHKVLLATWSSRRFTVKKTARKNAFAISGWYELVRPCTIDTSGAAGSVADDIHPGLSIGVHCLRARAPLRYLHAVEREPTGLGGCPRWCCRPVVTVCPHAALACFHDKTASRPKRQVQGACGHRHGPGVLHIFLLRELVGGRRSCAIQTAQAQALVRRCGVDEQYDERSGRIEGKQVALAVGVTAVER